MSRDGPIGSAHQSLGSPRACSGRPPQSRARVPAAAAGTLWLIASSKPGWVPGGFAANGYGDLSPGKYGLAGFFYIEVLMTFFFLFIIIGTTSKGAATGFAGIPIGFALTLIHLVSISVTNTSVNPARSTGPALFAGGEYLGQQISRPTVDSDVARRLGSVPLC